MKKAVSAIHFILCIAVLVAVIAEFLFAGMGVFHATSFAIHKGTGEAITYASYLLLVLSLIGLLGRTRILLSVLLVVLMLLQNFLVHVKNPFIAALHPLNGLVIMGAIIILVWVGARKTQKSDSRIKAAGYIKQEGGGKTDETTDC